MHPIAWSLPPKVDDLPHAEAELQRLDRALRAAFACSRALAHAQNEAALLHEMCRALVAVAGYRMAWIGYAEQDERRSVRPMARAGYEHGFLESLRPTWADTDRSREPAGTAIRSGKAVLVEDLRGEPAGEGWRAEASRRGYAAGIALPLRADSVVFGALIVYAAVQGAFREEEIRLLTDAADLVSFGVPALRGRAGSEAPRAAPRRSQGGEESLDALLLLRPVLNQSGTVTDFTLLEANPRVEQLLARPREQLVGRRLSEVFGTHHEELLRRYLPVLESGRAVEEQFALSAPCSRTVWVRHQVMRIAEGIAVMWRELAQASPALEANEAACRDLLARHASAEKLAALGTWSYDPASGKLTESGQMRRLLGLPPEPAGPSASAEAQALGADGRGEASEVPPAMRGGELRRVERRIVTPDGEERVLLLQSEPVLDDAGRLVRVDGIAQDITERKRDEARLRHLWSHDALTDLPNRRVLEDRVAQAIFHIERSPGEDLAVICLDLDRFELVNDRLGHSYGDALLKAVARALESAVREGDTVARQGGDEFIVLLRNVQTPGNVLAIAEKIRNALDRPFVVGGRRVRARCSMGASLYPVDGTHVEALLKNAHAAMQRAKQCGAGIQFYTRALGEQAEERSKLAAELGRALDHGEFTLHYQPQVALADGRLVGAEALIRWKRANEGFLSPDRFVSIAEESGLIGPIEEWVLREACAQGRRWAASGLAAIRVAVNVAASQFRSGRIEDIVAALSARGAAGVNQLELEVSERDLMTDVQDAIDRLGRLKRLGVRASIHNFGIGYSSLASLKRLPVERIKIDQSFVRDLSSSDEASALLRAIVALCHAFGFRVLAEGVETAQQAVFLAQHGCDECQGYYFGGPMPAERFEGLLRHGRFTVAAGAV